MVLSAIQTPQPRPECRQRNVMDERINTPRTEAEQDQDRESEASGGLLQLRRCDDEGCGPQPHTECRQRFRYGSVE